MKSSFLIICYIFILSVVCFARSDYAVLVDQSPVGAGEIKPGIGVHTFNADETVTLTAIARPGWRFVYWLGDVRDPTVNRTMLAVDGPKIVIAVFARDEFELPAAGVAISVGPEGLTRRFDNINSGGGGGSNPPSPPPTPPPTPPPIPEPQTLILMATGIYIICWKRFLINRRHRHQGARSPESLM
jgi:hypothetical protein